MAADAAVLRRTIESQHSDLKFHEAVATYILGQYPRANIHDPATYVASMARVLAQHADAVVLACADPAGGISSSVESIAKLTMKVLGDWLSREGARQENVARIAAMPKAEVHRGRVYVPPVATPNLWVPDNVEGHAGMVERHEKTEGKLSRYERRAASDGVTRLGIWVPLHWWEGGRAPIKGWAKPPAKEVVDDLAGL